MTSAVLDVAKKLETSLLPPKFTIAGIPVDMVGATFSFTLGANPFMIELECSDYTANKIWNATGGDNNRIPCNIHYRYYSINGKYTGYLRNLYVLERRPMKRHLTTLLIADPRYLWINRICVGRFNFKRRVNELDVIAGKKIHEVFKDYYLHNVLEYLPWSLKDSESSPPKAWKAIDLLDYFAKKYLGEWDSKGNKISKSFFGGWIQNDKVVSVDKVNWSDAAPDDMVFDGTNLIEAISKLLYLSRTNLAYFPNGKIYFFKTADDDIVSRLPKNYHEYTTTGTSFIYKSRKKRRRPSAYYVYADRVPELPCEYDHDRQLALVEEYKKEVSKIANERKIKENIGRIDYLQDIFGDTEGNLTSQPGREVKYGKDFDGTNDEWMFDKGELINVCPMPYEDTINGITYRRSEWVPIQILMESAGIPESLVRDYWYDNLWVDKYWETIRYQQLKLDPDADPELKKLTGELLRDHDKKGQMIVSAIVLNFWKTFMLHPKYRQRLLDFDVVRADVFNRPAGYQQPSTGILNYVDSPTLMVYISKNTVGKTRNVNSDIVDKDIEEILRLENSPFTLETVDKTNAFVFRIEQTQDRQDVHYAFTEGTLDKIPSSVPELKDTLFMETHKLPYFRMVCLISVKPAVPNDKLQMHITKVIPASPGYDNPHEIHQRKEPARYAWRNELSSIKDIPKRPINANLLANTAKTEAAMKEFEMRDWWQGQMRLYGIHSSIKPFGNAIISWEFTDSECSTIINMTLPPKAGSAYAWAPEIMREKVWRELPKQ